MIIKPTQSEMTVSSANTVYDARLVRIYSEANTVVTLTDGEGANTSFTVPGGSVTVVEKNATDTIVGSDTLLCTPISYK